MSSRRTSEQTIHTNGIPAEDFSAVLNTIPDCNVIQLSALSSLITNILSVRGFVAPAAIAASSVHRDTRSGGEEESKSQKPLRGEKGSGWSRTKSGKLVKNKKRANRSIAERQARNWRQRSSEAVIAYLQEHNVPKGTNPPDSLEWQRLCKNLSDSKTYQAYVKAFNVENESPLNVTEWRLQQTNITVPPGGQGNPVQQENKTVDQTIQ